MKLKNYKKKAIDKLLILGSRFYLLLILLLCTFIESRSQGFYSIEKSTGKLVYLTRDGLKTEVMCLNVPQPNKYQVGLVLDQNKLWMSNNGKLYQIDLPSGIVTTIASLFLQTNPSQSVFGPITFGADNQLYIFKEEGGSTQGRLLKVNTITGACSQLSASLSGDQSILAIQKGANGKIYALSEATARMLILNSVTGVTEGFVGTSSIISFPTALTLDENTLVGLSIMNETTSNTSYVYSINSITGASNLMYTLPGIYLGLAASPTFTQPSSRGLNISPINGSAAACVGGYFDYFVNTLSGYSYSFSSADAQIYGSGSKVGIVWTSTGIKELISTQTNLCGETTITSLFVTVSPTDLNCGLKAYYPFNGNANDESLNGNDGTIVNTITLTGNRFLQENSAYTFKQTTFQNSSDGFINVNNNLGSVGSGDFSYSVWYNTSDLTKTQYLMGKRLNDGTTGIIEFAFSNRVLIVAIGSTSNIQSSTLNVNNNEWHFATVSRENGVVKIYNDAVLVSTPTSNSNSIGGNMSFKIGASQGGISASPYGFVNGKLDEARFYYRALNNLEIKELYTEYCSTYFAQAPTISFDGTNLLTGTYAGANFAWSFNNTTLAGFNSNVYDGTLSQGTYTVTVTNAACVATSIFNQTADGVNLEKGLKAYYPFNGNANDASGNGNNVTTMIGSSNSSNRFIRPISSLSLTGVWYGSGAKYDNTNLNFDDKSFSINLWFNQKSSGTILRKGINGAIRGYLVQTTSDGRLSFGIGPIDGNGSSDFSATVLINTINTFALNKWHFVSINIDRNTNKVFIMIDGIKQPIGKISNSGGSISNNELDISSLTKLNASSIQPFTFGILYDLGYGGNGFVDNFGGLIDEVYMYNRALNLSEIQKLYTLECPGFVASFDYGTSPYCQYNNATITGTVTGGNFVAQTGLSINSVTGVVNTALSQPGVYNVEYRIPSQYGCTGFSGFAPLTISGVQNLTSSDNTCQNGTKTLTGVNVYSWSDLSVLGSIGDNVFFASTVSGIATVVGTNADGCVSNPVAFAIAPNPTNTTSADVVPISSSKTLTGFNGNIFAYVSGVGSVVGNVFNSGPLAGTATILYTNTLTGCNSTFTQTVSNGYEITPVSVNDCSTLPFTIPIISKSTVGTGIIGLDIELTFDPSIVTPTGVAYLGDVVTSSGGAIVDTYVDGNKLNINISYNGNGELSGSGIVVSPEFTLIPGTLANTYTIGGGNVRQSYEIYEDDVTVKPELFTVLHYLPTFTGAVFNWGNSVSPIINNTNTLSGVLNATALDNCVSLGKTSGTDARGTFVVEMGEGNYGVSIQRDIPNNTPVMDVINANDALTITRIANNSLRNPSALQLIAADVNGSGSITSGDRTLVQRRTLMLIKQFPNNVPDWKFYISTSTFTGFNRNRIPNVLTCIPLSSYVENGCVKLNNQSFVGVLMGNVDGIYNTNNTGGKNLRVEGEDQVIYDLSSAFTDSEGVTNVPIKLNYVGSVYAFDASIEYDEAAISIESMVLSDQNDVSAGTAILYNHFKTNHLLATVDKFEGLTNGARFATIKLKKSTSTLKAADLGKLDAFINGNRVSVSVNESTATSTTEASLTNLRIYPNPSESGIFNIDLPNANSTTSFEVFNSIGNPILHSTAKPFSSSSSIDLSGESSGIYFLKVSNGSNVVIKKIIVE